ncbi:hypothetical protein BD414DRAFT_516678 [Trametes punicea]|nr:hypothetical protein BD414DRAFT_516678 [Trametes punicea]
MPRPRARYLPRARSPRGSHDEDARHGAEPSARRSKMPSSPQHSRSRTKAEVVISTSRSLTRVESPAREISPDIPLSVVTRSLRTADKGKRSSPRPSSPEPPSFASKHRRERRVIRSPFEESCSPQPIPRRGRKRRRMSSSPPSDESPENSDVDSISLRSMSHRQSRRESLRTSGDHSDAAPPTSSPVRCVEEDERSPVRSSRNHSRARSAAPIPPLPLYPPIYLPFSSRERGSTAGDAAGETEPVLPSQTASSDMPLHQSRVMAWASFLMASGALPPLPPPPLTFGSGFHPGPSFSPYGFPSTPGHRRNQSDQYRNADWISPSSEAGPSRSSTYCTPTHFSPAYPYWFNPAYSSGTLPPSSPIPSSPIASSPVLRPASVPPGQRSKARGRRVSFKLDANDRPLSATPPTDAYDRDHTSDDEHAHAGGRSRSHSRGRRDDASKKPDAGKGKGKARAVFLGDESECDEGGQGLAGRAGPDRGRPPPRARTPGPPSRREQSVPRGRGSRTGKKGGSAGKD